MKLFKIKGNYGWLIYCTSSLDFTARNAQNVYINNFGGQAIMKQFYPLNISYDNVVLASNMV